MDGSGDVSFVPAPGQALTQSESKNYSPLPDTSVDVPDKSNFVPNCKKPITVNWPPIKSNPSDQSDGFPSAEGFKAAPSPNLNLQVLSTSITSPSNPMGANQNDGIDQAVVGGGPGGVKSPSNSSLAKGSKSPEIRIPDFKCPIRGPQRSWLQCVENAVINDQVRRPMARCYHKRPMPPLVIPYCKFVEMTGRATENERKRCAMEQRQLERETLRLRTRERQSKWNYTVESLLERKKQKEKMKEEFDFEDTSHLIEEVKVEKKVVADVQLTRAKKQMLYRKGLIRDFHSALGYSKMMQEIEQIKAQSNKQDNEGGSDAEQKKCMEVMMRANRTSRDKIASESESPPPTPKPIPTNDKKILTVAIPRKRPTNPRLLAQKQKTEIRGKELQQEMNQELNAVQELFVEYTRGLSEDEKKKLEALEAKEQEKLKLVQAQAIPTEPICKADQKAKYQEQYRTDLYNAIKDKLAVDAYIESHEKEIDRQACAFIEYKREVDAIQKAKEKQMIEEKVEYHKKKSEAAAKALIEFTKEKEARANVYDGLKDKWEAEWVKKSTVKKEAREKVLEKVVSDFHERKKDEVMKRCELDPARQWAREQLVAGENVERECERFSERRQKAADIVKFNKCQALEKKYLEDHKKYLDDVWGMKMKQEYVKEMDEMKSYAKDCIKDWEAKGRSPFPMLRAMKKWDYDSGMTPNLFADAFVSRQQSKMVADISRQANCPAYQTTSNRLGFNSGGS